MAGTQEGGRLAAQTNKERYGEDFYVRQGRKGGQISRGGYFADRTIGEDGLTNAERYGIIGGTKSRKHKTIQQYESLEDE